MYKGVLFDLDGVICDTAHYHYLAWKKLAQNLGADIDEEFNETLKGVDRAESLRRILKHIDVELTDEELIKNTVKYYDKVTTHDSSLSFSSYATVYAKLKNPKAYEYFLKNARLDLDNIHHNTKDGVHIASMGGTYQTVIDGFANMNIVDGHLTFSNNLPKEISYLKFNVSFKGQNYSVELEGTDVPKIIIND